MKKKAGSGAKSARELAVVILAAGKGTRMRSDRAKVLHEVAGTPMVEHVVDAAAKLKPTRTVLVVGHQRDAVAEAVGDRAVCVVQEEQLGTGHAVLQARAALRGFDGDVLVLCGDVPLIRSTTLRDLRKTHVRSGALGTVLSMFVDEPHGYGRVLRGEEDWDVRIVEEKDATPEERMADEVNSGMYCFDARFLFRQLGSLGKDNAQGEYYLTDLMEKAAAKKAAAVEVLEDAEEGSGVNSRRDLAMVEASMQERLIAAAMDAGVTFLDPATAYISARTKIGNDTVIGPSVRLEGETRIGRGCTLDGSSYLRNTRVGDGVLLRWGVVTDNAKIGKDTKIGPYAHLRPEALLAEQVHIGNFVEVKKSRIGRGSKANHLAYIGDAVVGRDANIGAGTITCNYDGFNKSLTEIGDRVQIGSDTQLVAPVKLGKDAYVAAGSTVTRDVDAGSLVFNDKPQRERKGWVAGFRKRMLKQKAAKAKKG